MRLLARKGVWYVRYRDASGKDRRKSLDTQDLTRAKQLLLKLELGLIEGQPLLGDEASVSWLSDWYTGRPRNIRPSSWERLKGALGRIRKELGTCLITDPLFRGRVKLYQAERTKTGAAPATVNREVGALKQVLNEAVDCFPGVTNPLLGLKQLRLPRSTRRALVLAEVRKVLSVLHSSEERLRFGLFAFTGMRRGEGVHLRWSSVDLDNSAIRIEPYDDWQPKNGDARIIPVCPELDGILREVERRSAYVLNTQSGKPFLADNGNPLLRWVRKVYRRAEIADWQELGIHTLRHTYCSRLAQLGVRAELRAAIVGHRTLAMQNLYTHTETEDALQAGRRLRFA